VAEILGRRIVSGEIRPGSALLNSTDMAAEMEMSRPALREAIKLLSGKGLVESKPRLGTVVRPRAAWNCLDVDVLNWQIGAEPTAAFIRDLYELRRFIEPEAAACAALRATPATLADIENAVDIMDKAAPASTASIDADIAFHRSILVASGNAFLVAFAPAIEASLRIAFGLQRQACPTPEHFVPDHRAIMDAIRRGDAETARSSVRRLLLLAETEAATSIREGRKS
jgi:DNA-binding FadR family transcriptional regulator